MLNFKNTFIKRGVTKDIIDEVLNCYNDNKHQCKQLILNIKTENYFDQCYSIFQYIADNVNYVADPYGVQLVKTPARLLKDKEGDCKSISIFIASCLHNLDIPFVFRFVSFAENSDYTHVYIVAKGDDEIIIDPVERVNSNGEFTGTNDYNGKFVFNDARKYFKMLEIKG